MSRIRTTARARMRLLGFTPTLGLALSFALSLAGTVAALGQEEGRELPNDEPSSFDALFERSDSGNVTQAAHMSYLAGVRDLKRADKLVAKLPELDGKKRAAAEENIVKARAGAVESFLEAIRTNPKLVDAYAGLATAYRQSNQHAEALQVSSRGLQLAPDDDALFAGWAESLLGLDMLGDATQAYGKFRETNPAWAEVLMDVMERWLAEHQRDPQGLSPEDVQRLAEWMAEQSSAAG